MLNYTNEEKISNCQDINEAEHNYCLINSHKLSDNVTKNSASRSVEIDWNICNTVEVYIFQLPFKINQSYNLKYHTEYIIPT